MDKVTNRYGGKGVIGEIRPDYLMPATYAGETFDIIANKEGIYGRENMGQLFELSCTSVGRQLVQYWSEESLDTSICYKMYLQYLDIISPSSAAEVRRLFDNASDDCISELIGSIIMDGYINVEVLPMSENMTIDKIAALYEAFPWMSQESITVPLVDSMGQVQYVTSRRPVVVGYVYYYRLKQYAKEKFSVTSLSATNIRNENSRNKASKNYKAPFSRTPIGFGYMEIGNMSHAGHGLIAEMLMLYASSPLARESYAELMTGDPFNIDIKLDDNASNRSAEIVQTLLKAIGKRIFFEKKLKEYNAGIQIYPMKYNADRDPIKPIIFYDPKAGPEAIQYVLDVARKDVIRPIIIDPLYFNMPYKDAKAITDKNEEMRLQKLAEDIENGAVDFE